MPILRHEEEVKYLHQLRTLVQREEKLVGLDRGYDMSFCCLGRPYDLFYLITGAADWWRELSFKFWQQTNVRGRQFLRWHNLEVFELPQSERDIYYTRIPVEWTRYKAARLLAVPTPEVYAYLTELVIGGTLHRQRCISRIAEAEFNIMSLKAVFRQVLFGEVRRLSYECMMVGCHGSSAMVRLPTAMIEELFELGILCLIRKMEMDLVLTLVAVASVVEGAWEALPGQEWFPYNYPQGMLVLRPGVGATAIQNAKGGEGQTGSQSVARPVNRARYETRGISFAFEWEGWRRYLANNVDCFVLPTPEVQDDLTNWQQRIMQSGSTVRDGSLLYSLFAMASAVISNVARSAGL